MDSRDQPLQSRLFLDAKWDTTSDELEYKFLDFYVSALSTHLKMERDLEQGLVVAFFLRQFAKDKVYINSIGNADYHEERVFRAADLEQHLAIPRETLRRKLISLEEQGVIEKAGAGGWKLRIEDGKPMVSLSTQQILQTQMHGFSKLLRSAKVGPSSL